MRQTPTTSNGNLRQAFIFMVAVTSPLRPDRYPYCLLYEWHLLKPNITVIPYMVSSRFARLCVVADRDRIASVYPAC